MSGGSVEDRWAKLEEIVRRVVREELSTAFQQKPKSKIRFEGGKFVGIGAIEVAALEAAYKAVDVRQELLEAAAWIVMNPNDAPKSNYGAFINSWLKKHQNRSAIRSIPTRSEPKPPSLCAYCDKPSMGTVSGIKHCSEHTLDAMDQKPRMAKA
jgi:hypothetical protein